MFINLLLIAIMIYSLALYIVINSLEKYMNKKLWIFLIIIINFLNFYFWDIVAVAIHNTPIDKIYFYPVLQFIHIVYR